MNCLLVINRNYHLEFKSISSITQRKCVCTGFRPLTLNKHSCDLIGHGRTPVAGPKCLMSPRLLPRQCVVRDQVHNPVVPFQGRALMTSVKTSPLAPFGRAVPRTADRVEAIEVVQTRRASLRPSTP